MSEYERADLPVPDSVGEPVGCPVCQHTGYKGRAPLIEILEVDTDLRDVVREGRAEAAHNPTSPTDTLMGHGLTLIALRRTSLAEVRRAVQAD